MEKRESEIEKDLWQLISRREQRYLVCRKKSAESLLLTVQETLGHTHEDVREVRRHLRKHPIVVFEEAAKRKGNIIAEILVRAEALENRGCLLQEIRVHWCWIRGTRRTKQEKKRQDAVKHISRQSTKA